MFVKIFQAPQIPSASFQGGDVNLANDVFSPDIGSQLSTND